MRRVSSKVALPARLLSSSAALPSYVISAPATEATLLPSGLRVASQSDQGETATVGVYIGAGSRNEALGKSGTAHLVEHLAFKGTAKVADPCAAFAKLGGSVSAVTDRSRTFYRATVLKKDVAKAVELLADIVQNSRLSDADLEKEKAVVLQEIAASKQNLSALVFDNLHDTAYQGTGLAHSPLGCARSLAAITANDLRAYVNSNYTAPRTVVVGAGAVEHKALVDLSSSLFAGLPKTSGVEDEAIFLGSEIRVREDTIPTAHMAIAFETAGYKDPRMATLRVMQALLGSWDKSQGPNLSSPLSRKLAEDTGLSSLTFNKLYKDTGLFGVYAVSEPTRAHTTAYHVIYELARLANNVTEEEVARARQQAKQAVFAELDGTEGVANDIGVQTLAFRRRMTPAEIIARLDAVDACAVKSVARDFIEDKDVAISALGNVHEMPDYNWIRRRTYWYQA